MRRTLTIKNLKSIRFLEFPIPGVGIHLLSGTNGSGKTTLLACLRRIGNPNAFPLHFKTSQMSDRLDRFTEAEIVYSIDEKSVTYAYAGERWVPTPRAESSLVRRFGFPQVVYAGATAQRITPRDEDFRPTRMNMAPVSIRDAANLIFETDRFSHLKTVNLTTGNRNQAFVLAPPPLAGERQCYTSERNFSLGELCVLKLLRELSNSQMGSLVLIDELEIALHPRAQTGLFNYLEGIAQDKALTVIVATHSVTLLKRAPRRSVMFIEQRNGETVLLKECFPAYALGSLSLAEERFPDIVIYVEDESARAVADGMLKLAITKKYSTNPNVFPTTRVVPVGDFKQVVKFYDRNYSMLPSQTKQWILLDKDVEVESLTIMASSSNSPMRDLFNEHSGVIRYLPWAPEVGLMEYLESDRQNVQTNLRRHFANAHVSISPVLTNLEEASGPLRRNECKRKLRTLVDVLCEQVGNGIRDDAMYHHLFSLLAAKYFQSQSMAAMQLFGPLVS
jgi:ABC-type cobalamin/Fe3+-siderophores transport system ATPase subunit